jgi:hypothetical protein
MKTRLRLPILGIAAIAALVSMSVLWAAPRTTNGGARPDRTSARGATDDLGTSSVDAQPSLAQVCLPSTPINCNGIPQPVGSTCSCESQALPKRCVSCGPVYRGQVVETTCTVSKPCLPGQTCHIQENFTRTGLSCAPLG